MARPKFMISRWRNLSPITILYFVVLLIGAISLSSVNRKRLTTSALIFCAFHVVVFMEKAVEINKTKK